MASRQVAAYVFIVLCSDLLYRDAASPMPRQYYFVDQNSQTWPGSYLGPGEVRISLARDSYVATTPDPTATWTDYSSEEIVDTPVTVSRREHTLTADNGVQFECDNVDHSSTLIMRDVLVRNEPLVLSREQLALCDPTTEALSILLRPISRIEEDALLPVPHIKYLHIRADVTELSADHLKNTPALRHVDLYLPRLQQINGNMFGKATDVTLRTGSGNYLKAGIFSGSAVESLALEGDFTTIEPGSFENMQNLEYLNINGTRISCFDAPSLSLGTSESLEQLVLTYNAITSLDENSFYGLSKLRMVDLLGNRITQLGTNIFATNTAIERVLLGNNRIACIKKDTFSTEPLVHLKLLDLTFNCLYSLDLTMFNTLPALRHISIVGNPFKCNCLDGVRMHLSSLDIEEAACGDFYDGNHPVCVIPRRGDETCFPRRNSSQQYVERYNEQFDYSVVENITTQCHQELISIFQSRPYSLSRSRYSDLAGLPL